MVITEYASYLSESCVCTQIKDREGMLCLPDVVIYAMDYIAMNVTWLKTGDSRFNY